MRKWLTPKKTVSITEPAACAAIDKCIHTLQTLTAVTQADFQALYVTTINHFRTYVNEPNQPPDETPLLAALQQAVLALKRRQGYLLPLGADSETAFREREEWTFAIFTAALCKSITVTVRTAVVKAILPTDGFAWLHRNTALFSLWQAYLRDEHTHNVFAELIDKQHDAGKKSQSTPKNVVKKPDKKTVGSTTRIAPLTNTVKTTSMTTTDTNTNANTIQVDNTAAKKVTGITEIDLNALADKSTTKNISANRENNNDNTPSTSIKSAKNAKETLPQFSAQDFWQWLQQNIHESKITWNQTDSFLHGVDLGILVIIPQAIDAFLTEQAKDYGMTAEDCLPRQRPSLTKAIKQHDVIIRNQHHARIHTYCIGQWQHRQICAGIVVPSEFLTNNPQTITINSQLTPDPLDAV